MIQPLIVNFGGPRDLDEIAPFLQELLCDRDVVWTNFPSFFHRWFFSRIAKKRAVKIRHDYALIGGRSPIFFDTEEIGKSLEALTFHRYLPATHKASLDALETCDAEEIRILPLFPQFTYATTGSIARFFSERLSKKTLLKLRWIKSYPDHPIFISSFQRKIRAFLEEKNLKEEETALLFSSHGVPKRFVEKGDPYEKECQLSYESIQKAFPKALCKLCFQSKFGRGEWLKPYTNEVSEKAASWIEDRKQVVFVPLSFTSDHIETLFEVEMQYLPLIQAQKIDAYRCPALNLEPYWIDGLKTLFQEETNLYQTHLLIR